MFERNPIDNASAIPVAVEVRLAGGATVRGRAALTRGTSVHRLLTSADDFLCVEDADGDMDFIPKSEIRGLKLIKPVVPRPLPQPSVTSDAFDPARILGVARGDDWAAVHAAYRRLAKAYHPDRFAGIDLPPEIAAYLDAKSKQINQAFRVLKAARGAGR